MMLRRGGGLGAAHKEKGCGVKSYKTSRAAGGAESEGGNIPLSLMCEGVNISGGKCPRCK